MNNEELREIIKKYKITQDGEQIRFLQPDTKEETERIKALKPELMRYFDEERIAKENRKKEHIEKAKRGEDGLFLVLECSTWGNELCVARRLNDEEKKRYAEWYRDYGMAQVETILELKHITWEELPHRKSEGSFSASGGSIIILTEEEFLKYYNMEIERTRVEEEEKRKRKEEKEAEKRKAEKERDELIAKVDNWEIKERTIFDEGGRTKEYTHIFRIGNETLAFTERNVFDFGVVINPDYVITDNKKGGLAMKDDDGITQWYEFNDGWYPVRPLTENEEICYDIVAKYGKFSHSGLRI